MEKIAILPENAGTTRPDHLILMLATTNQDIRDAWYTPQGIIATCRYPTDQAMPPAYNQIAKKHPTTLLMFQLMAMCY